MYQRNSYSLFHFIFRFIPFSIPFRFPFYFPFRVLETPFQNSKAKPNTNNTKITKGHSDFLRTFYSNIQGELWYYTSMLVQSCFYLEKRCYLHLNTFESTKSQELFVSRFFLFFILLFLAHLTWKLKWVFLIASRPSVNFSHFHLLLKNHSANLNQTWHKASLG